MSNDCHTNYYAALCHDDDCNVHRTIQVHAAIVDTLVMAPQNLKRKLPDIDLLHLNFG